MKKSTSPEWKEEELTERKSSCTVPEHTMEEPLIHNMLRMFAGLTLFLYASSCDDKCSRIGSIGSDFVAH